VLFPVGFRSLSSDLEANDPELEPGPQDLCLSVFICG